MVGRDVSLRGERSAFGLVSTAPVNGGDGHANGRPGAHHGAPVLRITDAVGAHPRWAGAARCVLRRRPRRRDRRAGRRRGQRPAGAGRGPLEPAGRWTTAWSRSTRRAVVTGKAGAMAAAGVAVIPEDRHDSGCVLDFTVAENLFIANPERVARAGLMDRQLMRDQASALIDRFSIACDGPDAPMWSLSGRQPAAGRVGAGAVPRSTGARRRATDPRPRRRRHRVHVRSAQGDGGGRRRRAADLDRVGGDPRPLGPRRGDVTGSSGRRDAPRATSTSIGSGCSWAAWRPRRPTRE